MGRREVFAMAAIVAVAGSQCLVRVERGVRNGEESDEERKELGPHRFPVNGLNRSPEPTAHRRSENLSSQKKKKCCKFYIGLSFLCFQSEFMRKKCEIQSYVDFR